MDQRATTSTGDQKPIFSPERAAHKAIGDYRDDPRFRWSGRMFTVSTQCAPEGIRTLTF